MTNAEKLFLTGGAHARAAHALIVAAQTNVHMNVPFYLLVGFALETVLKAAYLHLGGDLQTAKNEIGHNLPKALILAKENGFQPENENVDWIAETMAEAHLNHAFRYLTGEDDLHIPEADVSLNILDDLIAKVGQLIYPEHDRDYWIERLMTFHPQGA